MTIVFWYVWLYLMFYNLLLQDLLDIIHIRKVWFSRVNLYIALPTIGKWMASKTKIPDNISKNFVIKWLKNIDIKWLKIENHTFPITKAGSQTLLNHLEDKYLPLTSKSSTGSVTIMGGGGNSTKLL